MIQLYKPDYAALLLILTLGTAMIAHSIYLKLFVFTLPGTANFFTSIGLPYGLAYVVFTIEAVGGIGLIIGIYTRFIALLLIPILLGATWAHLGSGWLFTNEGGGWEYPLVLTLMAVIQVLLGGGAFALKINKQAV